jgi:hypothetical protein
MFASVIFTDVSTGDEFIGACGVFSSGSPVPISVEKPGPSNGQSPSTLVQFSARIKLSTTPSTDHIVSSPSRAHSYLPVVGPKIAINVTDISPLSEPRNLGAKHTDLNR